MKLSALPTLLTLPALLFALSSCTKSPTSGGAPADAPAGDVIRIGEVSSMTGSEATFGISVHNGISLAIEQANSAGGVKGKRLEIALMDDQSKPEQAATSITNLITQKKVIAVLGEATSTRALAMAPIAQNSKIPMLSPAATNPKVTEVGDYIFRVCFIDPFQGTVMAKFAGDFLKAKKVAVLRDMKSDYSIGLANFFIETFKKNGGEILLDQSYASGDMDFKSQLTAIKAKNPEAIFVPGYYTEVGLIARQARELGITVPLMGGDGWDSPKLHEIGGKAIVGSFFSNHYSAEDQSPAIQNFVKTYQTKYGMLPDGMAAMGYDAAKVMIDAMSRAKALTPADIRDALAATRNYPAVTGNISIDEKRNATKAAVVLRVVENGYKYQMTVNP